MQYRNFKMDKPYIVTTPKHTIIEKCALEMACVFYEASRSSGLKSESKTPQAWARKHFIKFIPQAISNLTDMLSRDNVAEHLKNEIYEAIQERINDPRIMAMENKKPDFDVKKLLDDTPEPPVIVNRQKFEPDKEILPTQYVGKGNDNKNWLH